MSHNLFEPWTIPDEAIYAVGADPSSACPKRIAGESRQQWSVCSWAADWFLLTIFVTARTVAELAKVTVGPGSERVRVPGRDDACTYIHCDYGPNAIGDLTFPVAAGLIIIRVATRVDSVAPEDPRVTAARIAIVLNRYLPQ